MLLGVGRVIGGTEKLGMVTEMVGICVTVGVFDPLIVVCAQARIIPKTNMKMTARIHPVRFFFRATACDSYP